MKRIHFTLTGSVLVLLATVAKAPAAAPTVLISRDALVTNRVVVSWPEAAGDFLAETTDRLGAGAVWWPARLTTRVENNLRKLTITAAASGRFYRLATNDYVAWFETAQGPRSAAEPAVVLPHEHIFTDLRGPTAAGYGEADPEDVVRVMKPLLVQAAEHGVKVLVECTSIGVGRNVGVIRRLADESGLQIVVPTGVYGRDYFAPAAHRQMTEDELTSLFIREIREGIEGTGIKAGFIKTATSAGGMTKLEEKFLRAAGRAARETGAVVASHTALGSAAKKQADILETISPAVRFIWVHAQSEQNRKWHRELAARGVFIEFDSLGWTPAEDSNVIAAIKDLLAAGYGDRVLLSHDAGWYQPGQPNGGTQMPYTYLLKTFVPKLRQSGVDDGTVLMLTRENPLRAFAFLSRRSEAPFPLASGR